MWHRLPHDHKRKPIDLTYEVGGAPVAPDVVRIPAGRATLGAERSRGRFGWDNEFGEVRVDVPAFEIDIHNVTNAEYLAFVEAGGYRTRELWTEADWAWRESEQLEFPIFWLQRGGEWYWHGMFEDLPLPLAWPVYVSQAEASAFALWRKRRLPTEAEYHRAAFGTPEGRERLLPWGDAPADPSRGNFDFSNWEPVPAGSRPAGASAWGVHDLVGNGWEWTSSVFGPFPGFSPMASYPEYSADFFDDQHYVMKGASSGHGQGARAAEFPQLVQAQLPLCVRDIPHCCRELATMAAINSALTLEFAADVRRDLALEPKQIQSKYLYDALGSSLFDAICRLPWYRITRAESRLLSMSRGPDRLHHRRQRRHDRRAGLRERREARAARRSTAGAEADRRAST